MGNKFLESMLRAAVKGGGIGETAPLAGFVDIEGVRRTIESLRSAFPPHFQHMFAAKANSMSPVLSLVREAGMGCEVASPGELEQALRCGFKPDQVVFDEPAKTLPVLKKVLKTGVALNIDNFQEFDRVSALLKETPSPSRIGFRINPQVGSGAIGAMSTATSSSKFGVALEDEGNRKALLDRYLQHDWLTTLHTHVGSQGCSLQLLTAGVRKVTDLAKQINEAAGHAQVRVIDIGGGLPVNFESEEVTPTFADYADELRKAVPELFDGEFVVKTEFGRSILAKNGCIVSRVEYTKRSGGRHIATCHAGAQVATRTVFMPEHWKLRVSVFDAGGRLKRGETVVQDIAGPLCFAGDLVASARSLPLIEPGDYIILHDTGAYYFSNPFYYNALPAPPVFGVQAQEDDAVALIPWRKAQTMDDMLAVIG
jgi:diaminopimelate decarboxylase